MKISACVRSVIISPSLGYKWRYNQSSQTGCSQVWGLCVSACCHGELSEKQTIITNDHSKRASRTGRYSICQCMQHPGLLKHRHRSDPDVCVCVWTHTWRRGRSGRPCVWPDWLSRAGNYSPSWSQRYWELTARSWCTCDHDSRTSPASAHTDWHKETKTNEVRFIQHYPIITAQGSTIWTGRRPGATVDVTRTGAVRCATFIIYDFMIIDLMIWHYQLRPSLYKNTPVECMHTLRDV